MLISKRASIPRAYAGFTATRINRRSWNPFSNSNKMAQSRHDTETATWPKTRAKLAVWGLVFALTKVGTISKIIVWKRYFPLPLLTRADESSNLFFWSSAPADRYYRIFENTYQCIIHMYWAHLMARNDVPCVKGHVIRIKKVSIRRLTPNCCWEGIKDKRRHTL